MSLERLRRDWTTLGGKDPLWAVLVDPRKRGGKWNIDEFFATGRAQIDSDMQWIEDAGVSVARGRALDFGCGPGRLSNALAAHFSEVVGVDVSETMLEQARVLDRSGGRLRFVHNKAPDLACLESDSFDLVLTDLVLQHIPPPLARAYLAELVRLTRPGGALLIAIPDRARKRYLDVLVRHTPQPLLRIAQRTVLRFPAPMRMHFMTREEVDRVLRAAGAAVRATRDDSDDPWYRNVRYLAVKAPTR